MSGINSALETSQAERNPPNCDDEFLQDFENCTLDPGRFHHSDHVHLAWIYLRRYPVLEALTRFTSGLKKFAASLGKHNLYHATITWGYLLLIHERMNRQPLSTWEEFSNANPDVMNWKGSILKQYYAEDTLNSELARKIFLFPDRIPSVNKCE